MKLAEYARYDGLGLADLVRQGQVTSRELGRLALDAVEAVNPTLNCVIQTLPERLVDLRDESVPNGPFKGVPFLIKDLLLFERGVLSEAGSLLAEGTAGRSRFRADRPLPQRRAGQPRPHDNAGAGIFERDLVQALRVDPKSLES